MLAEFEKVSYMKVVDFEILNNFYFLIFLSSVQNWKVILKF